jgi:hypothetical protein
MFSAIATGCIPCFSLSGTACLLMWVVRTDVAFFYAGSIATDIGLQLVALASQLFSSQDLSNMN